MMTFSRLLSLRPLTSPIDPQSCLHHSVILDIIENEIPQAETNNMEDNKILQVFERIDKLNSESKPLFGKMNVHQMICHCTDFYRMANGSKEANEYGTEMHLTLSRPPKPGNSVMLRSWLWQGSELRLKSLTRWAWTIYGPSRFA